MPLVRPASEVTILKVEPGGKPLTARSTNGTAGSLLRIFQSLPETLGMKTLGSNEGIDAMARMSPLFGSTTTADARPSSGCRRACSAIIWMRASMVR